MLHESKLPKPDPDAERHSHLLMAHIHAEIEKSGGKISFARYMELALYTPGLGYYTAGAQKFGKIGDFVTAPEISPLFSRCLARQCMQVLEIDKEFNILEFGAGTGIMAADLLLELANQKLLPRQYFILELSADLQERQRETLLNRCPELIDRIQWISTLPSDFSGIILANEVIDAMPVHRFCVRDGKIQEWTVCKKNDSLDWQLNEISNPALLKYISDLNKAGMALEDYESEVNLLMPQWIKTVGQCLKKGLILLIDYGFPCHEFFHPSRNRGTLMCHYRHYAHTDPFYLPGLQDITSHVDFTQVAEASDSVGLEVAGYTSQAAFLLSLGIHEFLLAENEKNRFNYASQIKMLTLPHEMGELFKVMALTRDLDISLKGFEMQDRRNKLFNFEGNYV